MLTNTLGERIDYTLDALGNRTQVVVKAAAGGLVRTQSRTFDELGRLLASLGAASQTTTYAYDANGNVVSVTDPLGRETSFAFDALDRLVGETDPLLEDAAYGYDARDNLTAVTDKRGLVTSYVYDGFGHVIQEASPETGATVFTVDRAGNRLSTTDARGVVVDHAYDALNRRTATTFPATPADDVAYTYDDTAGGNPGLGRLTGIADASGAIAFTYDDRGNVVGETRTIGGRVYDTDYAYDLADNLTEVVYPSGRIVAYARDGLGRVTAVTTRADDLAPEVTVADDIAYRPFGPIASLDLGNGLATTLAYDQDSRLTDIDTAAGGTVIQDLVYGHDATGMITAIDDDADPARDRTFAYDALDRLTQSTGAYGTIDYTYDANGNRLSRTITDGGTTAETYTVAAASNRLLTVDDGGPTRTLTYTTDGSMTTDSRGAGFEYLYNDAGRLTAVKEGGVTAAAYGYNALGQRVIKTAGAATTHYHYDRAGRLLAETDGTGATVREYIHLDGLPLALVTGGALYHVHPDHLATPQKMTDATQTVVWDAQLRPFGEAHSIAGTAANDQRFPGQLFDAETGFHYNYFHDYDPSTGRYLQSDPIGLEGGLNTYTYALGNPVSYVDPDGRNPLLLGIIGGAVGGALVDAGLQLLKNGGQLACLDYGQIGRSAVIGGALGGLGRVGLGLLRGVSTRISPLKAASEAAFKAADNVSDFAVPTKHLAGSSGRWARFGKGVDPNIAIRDALTSPNAKFYPNNVDGSFRVVTDLGRTVGDKGQTSLRVVVGQDGKIWTAFPSN